MSSKIIFEVDGACRNNGNPGAIGAAAAVQIHEGREYKHWTKKVEDSTYTPTNSRAELTALIMALEIVIAKYTTRPGLPPHPQVDIYSDSQYAVNCAARMYRWAQNNWRTSSGQPVKNLDLVHSLMMQDNVVSGIAGVKYYWIPREHNQRADRYCNQRLNRLQRGYEDSNSDYYAEF